MAENDPGANQMIEKMMEFLIQQNVTLDKSEKLLRAMAEQTGAVAEEAGKATGKIKDLFKYTDDAVDRYKEMVKYAKKRSEMAKEEVRDAKKARTELQHLVDMHEEALKNVKSENKETKQMRSNLEVLRKTMQGIRTEGNLLDSEMDKVGEAFEVCARNAKEIAKAMSNLSQRGAAMKGMLGIMGSLGVGRGLNQRIEKRFEQISDVTDKINEARSMRKQATLKSMGKRREGIMASMGPITTEEDYNVFASRMGFKGKKAEAFIGGEKNIASGYEGGAEYAAAMGEGAGGLAKMAEVLEGGMSSLLEVAPEIIIPLEILAEVIKALISIFDTYVHQNQAMEKQIGAGGLFTQPGQGAGEAFQRARWALMPNMLDTDTIQLGQTFERNLAVAGGLSQAGYGVGDQFRQPNVAGTPFGPGGIGEAQKIVQGVSRVAGMGDEEAIANLIKLLQQYGETMAGAENFMTRINKDTQAAGISTTKYIKILDEVNGAFTKMTKNLDESVGVMQQLSRYGNLSSETLKDLMEGLLTKGPGAGMGDAALGAYAQQLAQGTPQLDAARRSEKGAVLNLANNVGDELKRAGMGTTRLDTIRDLISKGDFKGAQKEANVLGGDIMGIGNTETRQTATDALEKMQKQILIASNTSKGSALERSLGQAAFGGPDAIGKLLQNYSLLNNIRGTTGMSLTDIAAGGGGERAKGMIAGLDELYKQAGFPSFIEGARRMGQGRIRDVETLTNPADQAAGYARLSTELFKTMKRKNGIPIAIAENSAFAKYWKGNDEATLEEMKKTPQGIKDMHDMLEGQAEDVGSTAEAQAELIDAAGKTNEVSDEALKHNLEIAKEAGIRTQTLSDLLKNIFTPLLSSISESVEFIATLLSKSKLLGGGGDPQRMTKDMAAVGKAIDDMTKQQQQVVKDREELEQKKNRGGKLSPAEQKKYDELTDQAKQLTDSIDSFSKVHNQGYILSQEQMENVEKALDERGAGKRGVKIDPALDVLDPNATNRPMRWRDVDDPNKLGAMLGQQTRGAVSVAYHYYMGQLSQYFDPPKTAGQSGDTNVPAPPANVPMSAGVPTKPQ